MSALYSIRPAAHTHQEQTLIRTLPILLLNVHSQCNCRCVMCDIWKQRDGSSSRASDLERHRASIVRLGVRHIVLTGGEPLLNLDLDAICQFFRELGVRTTLLTTGLLLLKRADTVAKCFDDIIVSIDGPADIHDQIRNVPGAFRLIQRGIAAVRSHNPAIAVSCRTTVQKLNHQCLRSTVAAARSLELDSISFLPADLFSGAFNREQKWEHSRQNEIALTREECDALHHEIEALISSHYEEIGDGFILENAPKLRRIVTRFREYLGDTPPRSPQCNAPWVSAVIDVEGGVRPCFFHDPIANLNQLTLEEAVNSWAAKEFRRSLDIPTNPTCQRCVCSLNYKGNVASPEILSKAQTP